MSRKLYIFYILLKKMTRYVRMKNGGSDSPFYETGGAIMVITFSDLIQLGIFIVTLIGVILLNRK